MEVEQMFFDVSESQKIEHIDPQPTSQLFQLHLQALQHALEYIDKGEIPDVRHVHRVLTASTLTSAGSYRYDPVFIGGEDHPLPRPTVVSELMEEWCKWCEEFIRSTGLNASDQEDVCSFLYYHFLCIHPFEDGNGRVGRIMYNSLRVLKGLPWHTITVEVHTDFLIDLRNYEDKVFREEYRDMY